MSESAKRAGELGMPTVESITGLAKDGMAVSIRISPKELDGRNALDREQLLAEGFEYLGMGR